MCGPNSAIGLEDHERQLWAEVKERLREPGLLTGLMRGFLGNEEVAVVVGIEPEGRVWPLAVPVTQMIEQELVLPMLPSSPEPAPVYAHVGEYPVRVWLDRQGQPGAAVAIEVTPWIVEHLLLYARLLWYPPRQRG